MFLAIPYFELKTIYLFGSTIPFWMVTFWIGRVFFLFVILVEAKRLKLEKTTTGLIFLLTLILNQLFEKTLFWLSHNLLHTDGSNFSLVKWENLGRVYFGAIIGSFLAVLLGLYISKKMDKLGYYLDAFFLGHIAALIFYRIGNLLAHSHIGKVTNSVFGMEYFGQVRFEPSLYEVFILLFFFGLIWFLRKEIVFSGLLFLISLGFISLMRFFLDFLRSTDQVTSNFRFQNGLSLNQVAYFFLFITCYLIIFLLFKKHGISVQREIRTLLKKIFPWRRI